MPWYTFEPSWEPFRGMDQLRREMDRLWEQAYRAGALSPPGRRLPLAEPFRR